MFRKNLWLKDVFYSRLKAIQIIGQSKAFYEVESCAWKETVDLDILVTSRNGD